MSVERVSLWQITLLFFISRSVIAIAELPVRQAGRDAWIAMVLTTLIGVPIILTFVGLARRHPEKSIFEYANDLLGPWLGRLVTLPLLWGFLHFSAYILRLYGEMIVTAVLPQTPLVFIMGGMIAVSAAGVRAGLEAIGRCAEILVPLFLLAIVTVTLVAIPDAEFNRLRPIGAEGFDRLLSGTLAGASFYFFYTVILVVYPAVAGREKLARMGILATVAAEILITAVTVVALGIFGPYELLRLSFPFLHLARNVRIAEFIERVETIALAAWGAGLFLELSLIYHAGSSGLAQWLGVRDHRRLVLPMGSILLTLALLLFPNAFQFREFFRDEVIGPYSFLLIVPLPAILWVASLVKGARARRTGRREERGRGAPDT